MTALHYSCAKFVDESLSLHSSYHVGSFALHCPCSMITQMDECQALK